MTEFFRIDHGNCSQAKERVPITSSNQARLTRQSISFMASVYRHKYHRIDCPPDVSIRKTCASEPTHRHAQSPSKQDGQTNGRTNERSSKRHQRRKQNKKATEETYSQSRPTPNQPKKRKNKHATKMCVEIHHLLACGHYNDDHPTPYQIVECPYPSLSASEQRFWDRVNGKHELLEDGARSFDWNHSAVCEECRELEDARLARGEMLRWPGAKSRV